jgi:hypothetical protein
MAKKTVEQIHADRDDREMMRTIDAWPGPMCMLKHKDFTIAGGDPDKHLGVILDVVDYEEAIVKAVLDCNMFTLADSAQSKIKDYKVDDLIEQGWMVD